MGEPGCLGRSPPMAPLPHLSPGWGSPVLGHGWLWGGTWPWCPASPASPVCSYSSHRGGGLAPPACLPTLTARGGGWRVQLLSQQLELWSQQSPGTVTRTQQEGWRQRCHRGNCDARSCSKGLRAAGSGRAGSTVHGACTALQISHTSQHICAACRSLPDVPPALGTFLPGVVEVGRAASCPARSWHAGPSRQDRD